MYNLYNLLANARLQSAINRTIVQNYSHRIKGFRNNELVSIVCCTARPQNSENIVRNIFNQNYENIEVIIYAENYNQSELNFIKNKINDRNITSHIVLDNSNITLGERRDAAIGMARGQYIAHMDDDDIYLSNYLSNSLLAINLGNYDIVGKASAFYIFKRNNHLFLRFPSEFHLKTHQLRGSSLFFRRSLSKFLSFGRLNQGEDSHFLHEAKFRRYSAYASDPFNYIVVRSEDTEAHTFKRSEDNIVSESYFVTATPNLKIIEF